MKPTLVDLVPTKELDFNLVNDLLRKPHIYGLGRSIIKHLHIKGNRHYWVKGSERIYSVHRGRNFASIY